MAPLHNLLHALVRWNSQDDHLIVQNLCYYMYYMYQGIYCITYFLLLCCLKTSCPANTIHWANVGLMWPTVCDAGPTLNQLWLNELCLLGDDLSYTVRNFARRGQKNGSLSKLWNICHIQHDLGNLCTK